MGYQRVAPDAHGEILYPPSRLKNEPPVMHSTVHLDHAVCCLYFLRSSGREPFSASRAAHQT